MRVHLMGAGGAGVSALARVFLARNDEVSGCDLKESETTKELEDAGVRLDVSRRTAERDGEPVQLTYVEFEILRSLMRSPGRVLSRRALLERRKVMLRYCA